MLPLRGLSHGLPVKTRSKFDQTNISTMNPDLSTVPSGNPTLLSVRPNAFNISAKYTSSPCCVLRAIIRMMALIRFKLSLFFLIPTRSLMESIWSKITLKGIVSGAVTNVREGLSISIAFMNVVFSKYLG